MRIHIEIDPKWLPNGQISVSRWDAVGSLDLFAVLAFFHVVFQCLRCPRRSGLGLHHRRHFTKPGLCEVHLEMLRRKWINLMSVKKLSKMREIYGNIQLLYTKWSMIALETKTKPKHSLFNKKHTWTSATLSFGLMFLPHPWRLPLQNGAWRISPESTIQGM